MKKLLLLCAFFVALLVNAQEKVTYTEVIKVNDSTKNAKYLYASAKMWFSKSFTDPKETIILDDAENNIIMGRGFIKYDSKILLGSATREGYIFYDVTISCKKGRYKYEFTNFTHHRSNANGGLGIITTDEIFETQKGFQAGPKNFKMRVVNELKERIATTVEPLVISLKSSMNETISTKEDW